MKNLILAPDTQTAGLNSSEADEKMRCGYVALTGLANAGKSSLLNALVKVKIAGVSAKPQTTRRKILGVVSEGDCQFLFLDMPGLQGAGTQKILLNKMMEATAWQSLGDADVIFFMIDLVEKDFGKSFELLSYLLTRSQGPILILASKVDKLKKEVLKDHLMSIKHTLIALLEKMPQYKPRFISLKPFPVSSKSKLTLSKLLVKIEPLIPLGPWLYSEDDITDLTTRQIAAELIKEQLFRYAGQEIPYGTSAIIDKIEEKPNIVHVHATILVSRESFKKIIVGQHGTKIKSLGTAARKELERFFDRKVFLDIHVKLKKNWTKDADQILNIEDIQIS